MEQQTKEALEKPDNLANAFVREYEKNEARFDGKRSTATHTAMVSDNSMLTPHAVFHNNARLLCTFIPLKAGI